ncbi:hypothetical protein KSP39_PZI015873 [Platanthera zijinensis]|uniref:Retrotransposon gag domain-containing protein n=1 Tax=Platanthera zijinensis TaxID=2320716 RepID=A0AAP0B8V7_9ASPA
MLKLLSNPSSTLLIQIWPFVTTSRTRVTLVLPSRTLLRIFFSRSAYSSSSPTFAGQGLKQSLPVLGSEHSAPLRRHHRRCAATAAAPPPPPPPLHRHGCPIMAAIASLYCHDQEPDQLKEKSFSRGIARSIQDSGLLPTSFATICATINSLFLPLAPLCDHRPPQLFSGAGKTLCLQSSHHHPVLADHPQLSTMADDLLAAIESCKQTMLRSFDAFQKHIDSNLQAKYDSCPHFSHRNPVDWLYKLQMYFSNNKICPANFMIYATLHLDRPASNWYLNLLRTQTSLTFPFFIDAIIKQYGSALEDTTAVIKQFQQATTFKAFQTSFEESSTDVSVIPPIEGVTSSLAFDPPTDITLDAFEIIEIDMADNQHNTKRRQQQIKPTDIVVLRGQHKPLPYKSVTRGTTIRSNTRKDLGLLSLTTSELGLGSEELEIKVIFLEGSWASFLDNFRSCSPMIFDSDALGITASGCFSMYFEGSNTSSLTWNLSSSFILNFDIVVKRLKEKTELKSKLGRRCKGLLLVAATNSETAHNTNSQTRFKPPTR